VDGLPDLLVLKTDRRNPTGNHVIPRCGEFLILLAHMRHGSVKVRAGDEVTVGDEIGAVGNTGEPHLHIHAQRPGPTDAPLASDGVPILFAGRFLVRNDVVELDSSLGIASGRIP
jgi:hypothetical protein